MNEKEQIFWKTVYDVLCKKIGCSKIEIGYTNALCAIIGCSLCHFWLYDSNSPIRVSNGVGNYRNIVETIFNVLKTDDISINGKILKKGLTFEQAIIEGDLNG